MKQDTYQLVSIFLQICSPFVGAFLIHLFSKRKRNLTYLIMKKQEEIAKLELELNTLKKQAHYEADRKQSLINADKTKLSEELVKEGSETIENIANSLKDFKFKEKK